MLQLSQIKTAPNQLTLLRLVFIPFIVGGIIEGNYERALILLIIAGVSDALDGLLARALQQKTLLGQYLDPIADKLLLSTLFLVLALEHRVPWRVTTVVFSRDLLIIVVSTLVYVTTSLRDFSPSIWGKMNTASEIGAVFFVILAQVADTLWVTHASIVLLWLTFILTVISGLHYILLLDRRLKGETGAHQEPPQGVQK